MASRGPITFLRWPVDAMEWAYHICAYGCQCNGVGLSHMHMWLPIATPGPTTFLGSAPDTAWWAHFTFIYSCRYFLLGPLESQAATTNQFTWARFISGCHLYHKMDLLYIQLIASLQSTIFFNFPADLCTCNYYYF